MGFGRQDFRHLEITGGGQTVIRFLSHILRFIIITLAFVLAIVGASAFILALGWGGMLRGDPESERLLGVAVGVLTGLEGVFLHHMKRAGLCLFRMAGR